MNKRQMHMLDYLLKQTDYVASSQIAQLYGVSAKTIYHDLAKLNEALAPHGLAIDKSPRNGVRLDLSQADEARLRSLIKDWQQADQWEAYGPDDRERHLLKGLCLEPGGLDLEDLAEQLYVSSATLNRDLSRLGPRFQACGLTLVRQDGRLQVQGRESAIRQCLRTYLQEWLYQMGEPIQDLVGFFQAEDITLCQHALNQLSQTYQHDFTADYYLLLLLECLIIRRRGQLGQVLQVRAKELVRDLSHLEVYFFAGELLEAVTGQALVQLSAIEIESLAYTLLAVGFKVQSPDYERELRQQVQALIQRVSDFLNVDLSQDQHLLAMLANHMSSMIFRLRHHMHVTNPALDEIRKQYLTLFNIVWLVLRDFAEHYDMEVPDEELAFLVIHFQIALEKVQRPLTIVVVCQHGLAASELILAKLQRIFSPSDRLLNLKWQELADMDWRGVDLVISSLDLKDELPVPVQRVSPIMTQDELEQIRHHYDQLTSGHHQMVKALRRESSFHVASLAELIKTPDQVQLPANNQDQAIELVLAQASPQNLANPAFARSVYEREQMGATSVYTGVALPHSDPKTVTHSEIVLVSLAKPISWGQNQVKLIFLIAVAERDMKLFKESLVALYALIEDQELMDQLSQCQDGASLKARLLEEVNINVR